MYIISKELKINISVCEGCDVDLYLKYFQQWKICISSVDFYFIYVKFSFYSLKETVWRKPQNFKPHWLFFLPSFGLFFKNNHLLIILSYL